MLLGDGGVIMPAGLSLVVVVGVLRLCSRGGGLTKSDEILAGMSTLGRVTARSRLGGS